MVHYINSQRWRRVVLLLSAGVLPAAIWASNGMTTVTGATSGDAYQIPALDRYLVIVNRMPFGMPPSAPVVTNVLPGSVAAAAVELSKNFVLFEIVRTPVGDVVVGFTDNGAKPPRNLLLAVGEEADGYKVVAADVDLESATLEKDGTRVELRMNAAVPSGMAPASPTGGTRPASMAELNSRMARMNPGATPTHGTAHLPARQPVPNSVGVIDRMLDSGLRDNSYVARLRERREQLLQQAEAEQGRREQDAQTRAQAVSTDGVDQRLRETNLNLIRKGLKPMGTIELTPEEDAKLVSEGVLPAP